MENNNTPRNTANNINKTQIKSRQTEKVENAKSNSVVRRSHGEMRAVKKPRIVTVKKTEKSPFPYSIIFTALAFTVMFLFLMMNYAELDKYNSQLASMQDELTQLKSEEAKLNEKLNKRDDLTLIENYAKDTLGMVKADELPTEYVDIVNDDKTDVVKYDDTDNNGVGFLLSGFSKLFDSFFGE